MEKQNGQSLTELVVAMAVVGFMASVATSAIDHGRRNTSLAAATSELRSIFQQVRAVARARDRSVGIRFRPDGDLWTWTVYEDGDGDGVRNEDIARGTDFMIERPRRFQHRPSRIGLPDVSIPDPMAPGRLLSHRLPVRFGTSLLCSFSRQGEATNGSVVLTDGDRAVIVRVHGKSARINVLRWDGERWITGV